MLEDDRSSAKRLKVLAVVPTLHEYDLDVKYGCVQEHRFGGDARRS